MEQANMLGGSIMQLNDYSTFESLTLLKDNIEKIYSELKTYFAKEGYEYIHYFNSKTCHPSKQSHNNLI